MLAIGPRAGIETEESRDEWKHEISEVQYEKSRDARQAKEGESCLRPLPQKRKPLPVVPAVACAVVKEDATAHEE